MRRVILESPYAGDIEENVEYARKCVRDALSRGEAPIASHLLYTQPGILRDEVPDERRWGVDAGLAWGAVAEATVVYTDLGISNGMRYGIRAAERSGRPIEHRSLAILQNQPNSQNADKGFPLEGGSIQPKPVRDSGNIQRPGRDVDLGERHIPSAYMGAD